MSYTLSVGNKKKVANNVELTKQAQGTITFFHIFLLLCIKDTHYFIKSFHFKITK